MGKHAEAIDTHQRTIKLRPGDAKLHKALGIALARHEKFDEASASYSEALRLRPDYADAHNDMGILHARQHRYPEAEASYREAIRIRPDYAEAYNNLGNTMRNLGNYGESLACYEQALKLKPSYADAHNNKGITLSEMGRLDEAVESYTRCIKLRPMHIDAHMNRALTWLRKGDYAQGWAAYEWRWRKRAVSGKPLVQPLWNGFPLKGRRILLFTEQGLGDTIQFIRYAPILKAQGATVQLECPEKLLKILERCEGVDQVIQQGKDLPDHDVYAPLMTIPGLVDTALENIPAVVPYVHTDPELVERWGRELGNVREFKVGINWQGNAKYGGDRHRSIPLSSFKALSKVPGARLYSLQKHFGAEQLAALGDEFEIVDLGPRLDEQSGPFMDTAAVMKNLDLFVTSDTSVAHLAGALGVPVWMAVSATPGWQWMTGRDDCPWYPTMRFFRQERPLVWDPVFERIAHELAKIVPARCRSRPVAVEVSPADLIDRLAAAEARLGLAAAGEEADRLRQELAALSATRDRRLGDWPALADAAAELRAIHSALLASESAIRSCEQAGDFGPAFVSHAQAFHTTRSRRELLLERLAAIVEAGPNAVDTNA